LERRTEEEEEEEEEDKKETTNGIRLWEVGAQVPVGNWRTGLFPRQPPIQLYFRVF
jgi:hypothetical protein